MNRDEGTRSAYASFFLRQLSVCIRWFAVLKIHYILDLDDFCRRGIPRCDQWIHLE